MPATAAPRPTAVEVVDAWLADADTVPGLRYKGRELSPGDALNTLPAAHRTEALRRLGYGPGHPVLR